MEESLTFLINSLLCFITFVISIFGKAFFGLGWGTSTVIRLIVFIDLKSETGV